MEFSPNLARTPLHHQEIPDGPLTPAQRALADAVRGCESLADFVAAPSRQTTAITVCDLPQGMDEALARAAVERGIAQARREIDRLEATLHAVGPTAFLPVAQPVRLPKFSAGVTRHAVVVALMRHLHSAESVLVRAGDAQVSIDDSATYRVNPGVGI